MATLHYVMGCHFCLFVCFGWVVTWDPREYGVRAGTRGCLEAGFGDEYLMNPGFKRLFLASFNAGDLERREELFANGTGLGREQRRNTAVLHGRADTTPMPEKTGGIEKRCPRHSPGRGDKRDGLFLCMTSTNVSNIPSRFRCLHVVGWVGGAQSFAAANKRWKMTTTLLISQPKEYRHISVCVRIIVIVKRRARLSDHANSITGSRPLP